jgi:hypothetical protein
MKRLKYISDEKRITSFTFEDNLTGNVVIVTEQGSNPITYSSISVPIEQLELFVKEYKLVKENVKFAGLA